MDKEEWSFTINGFGIVRVNPSLIQRLAGFRQLASSTPESGGILIGKHLNSGGKLIIDDLTPPQKEDHQGRSLFFRSETHNTLAQKIWHKSKHHSTYVGLWHTHPELIPSFSKTDRNDWLNALNHSQYEGNKLFFFIVGQSHIRCWLGTKKVFRNQIKFIGEIQFGNE